MAKLSNFGDSHNDDSIRVAWCGLLVMDRIHDTQVSTIKQMRDVTGSNDSKPTRRYSPLMKKARRQRSSCCACNKILTVFKAFKVSKSQSMKTLKIILSQLILNLKIISNGS